MERGLGPSGLVTAAGLQMGVSHIGPSTPQHRMLQDRWLPNMLHDPKPHMLYSWEPPYSHKRCRSQQESLSLSTDLSGERSRSITSYSINLGKALCQLKVEGAIIWALAELASFWPSMCYCRMWEWRHNVKIYIQPGKHPCVSHRPPPSPHHHHHTHTGVQGAIQSFSVPNKKSHNTKLCSSTFN